MTPAEIHTGQILHVTAAASVQFVARPILFRVIRVMEQETRNTYADWAWLEGYELNADGDAVERREIFVQPAGLRLVTPATRPAVRPRVCPVIPRPRTSPEPATTTRRTR